MAVSKTAADDLGAETFAASTNVEYLPMQIEDLTYEGFNQIEFIRTMREKSCEANVLENHTKNMVQMGLVCSIINFNVKKVLASPSTSEKWRNFMANMKRIYGLLDTKADSPTAATLSRMMLVTALPVIKYYWQDNGKHITPIIEPSSVARGYPFCMCANSFAALIPTSVESTEALCKAHAYYQFLQSRKMGGEIHKNRIMEFVRLVMKISLYPETTRLASLTNFGIITAEGRLAWNTYRAISKAASKFDSL